MSEEYGYDYSDMNAGGEVTEIFSLIHTNGTKIFVWRDDSLTVVSLVRQGCYFNWLLEINSLLPHYWSELFLLAEQLLSPEEREELHQRIFDIEKMVFEIEVIPRELDDGRLIWVERIKGHLSLYDIEMAIESNPDYYAYFTRDDGTSVSKFDIERQLDKVKKWLYSIVRDRSQGRRFSRFR